MHSIMQYFISEVGVYVPEAANVCCTTDEKKVVTSDKYAKVPLESLTVKVLSDVSVGIVKVT